MKKISYAGESVITGNAVAEALAHYVTVASNVGRSASVEIPVFELNGVISQHTMLITPTTQLIISDADGGKSPSEEEQLLPVPEFPPIGGSAVPTSGEDAKLVNPPILDDIESFDDPRPVQ